jgi:asparagine synthase (glutamine-hydrolysing)
MISDVPLGAFLSGGMDSASVVALMSECSSKPIKTFTIGYGEKDASFNELETARVVAEAFGTEHREFILSPDVVELLPEILRATGEPFADSSSIPTYLISRETRKHVTVALSGIGGDEIFMGYPRYLGARLSEMYDKVPAIIRNALISPLVETLPESTRSRNIGGWIKRFIRGGRLDPVHRYLSWITFCSPEMKQALYTGDFAAVLKENDVTNIHREYLYRDNRLDYVKSVSYLDMNTYLPDDLLFMGDTMSMAHSLELRVPFCDHKLVEFMLNVPARIKMKGFRLKGLMKSMMKGRLPKEVLQKRKQGFMVPIGSWFQRDLHGFIRETLLSDRAISRGFFEKSCVERMLADHFQGSRILTHQLWSLLTFEIWCRLYLDREGTPRKQIVMTQAG